MRTKIFRAMSDEWIAAYDAGVFTEFMEQRAPGHTVLDDKIYRKGMLDFIDDIDSALGQLDYLNDLEAYGSVVIYCVPFSVVFSTAALAASS